MAEATRNGQPGGGERNNSAAVVSTQYEKIYNVLKEMERYNVSLSVPEFVFVGFQSSGKTSAVSQAAQLAMGVMKHGTASRCPTRFKMVTNAKAKQRIITVNGKPCKNLEELTNRTLRITQRIEESGTPFTDDIIEVRIEAADVAELTFVDLPGLLKGNAEKYQADKKQLDQITAKFLHEQNPDGTYRYMPILVREPVDVEHDTRAEVAYIDNLVQKWDNRQQQRHDWQEDTLFIVNKFDKQMNRSSAQQLMEYMKYCCQHGQTVLTIMNANQQNTASMSHQRLSHFVHGVQCAEEEKWNDVIKEFQGKHDEYVEGLLEMKSKCVGVAKMRSLLSEKMCQIVKGILPTLENRLSTAEKQKRDAIESITREIALCDPEKIRQTCISFNNRFMLNLQRLYGGKLAMELDAEKKNWSTEVNDFHAVIANSRDKDFRKWVDTHTIKPNSLAREIRNSLPAAGSLPALLLSKLNARLLAGVAIQRILDVWVTTVSLMAFPRYSDEDVINSASDFGSTRRSSPWITVQNLVQNATNEFKQAAKYLGEFLRYRLKENADLIFKYSVEQTMALSDKIVPLLCRSLNDYKHEIENIIDEFIDVARVVPDDQANTIDRSTFEEAMNMGKLMKRMLKDDSSKWGVAPSGSQSLRRSNGVQSPTQTPPQSPSPQLNRSAGKIKKRSIGRKDYNQRPMADDSKDDSKDDDLCLEMHMVDDSKDDEQYDRSFFKAVLAQKKNHKMDSDGLSFDQIRHLACCFWTHAKYSTMRDIQQKVSNLVMAPVRGKDRQLEDAVQVGVDHREVSEMIKKLVDKTGVGSMQLELLIKKHSTLEIPRAVTELSLQQITEEFGSDLNKLTAAKQKSIQEFKDFKELMKRLRIKINHIKNNSIDQIGDDELDEAGDDELDEDDVDDKDAVYTQGHRLGLSFTDETKEQEEDDDATYIE